MSGELLRRNQSPFLLPTRAERLVGTVWTEDAAVLAALAKRTLYPPAGWPEERDDTSSVRGPVRLTFAGDFPGGLAGAALVLRVRARRFDPVCALHGPVVLLGHNVQTGSVREVRNGWHPGWLALGVLLTPNLVVELRLNQPVSRALLTRVGGRPPVQVHRLPSSL